MLKLEQARRVGHLLAGYEVYTKERPHRVGVATRAPTRLVRQDAPALKQVHTQHPLGGHRLAATFARGVGEIAHLDGIGSFPKSTTAPKRSRKSCPRAARWQEACSKSPKDTRRPPVIETASLDKIARLPADIIPLPQVDGRYRGFQQFRQDVLICVALDQRESHKI